MVDAKAALVRNRRGERRDGVLAQVLDVTAGGADQVMVVARLAPHVGRDVARALEPLGEPGGNQSIERTEDRGAPNIRMATPNPVVDLLRRGLFSGL